jgi:hypothetical protein
MIVDKCVYGGQVARRLLWHQGKSLEAMPELGKHILTISIVKKLN